MKSDLKRYKPELVQFDSLNKKALATEAIDSEIYELINKVQKSAIKAIEHAVFLIFNELKIEFSYENLKRITKIYPDSILGAEKYYFDYGKESEVFLFSSEWEMPDFSKNVNPLKIMHKIKSDFKCINSFYELCDKLEEINKDFNANKNQKRILNFPSSKELEQEFQIFMNQSSNINEDGLLKRIQK